MAAAGIPSAPVRTLPEVGSDPHIFERGVVRDVDYPPRGLVKVLGTPIKLSTHAEPNVASPPRLGQHTDEVLTRILGLQPAEIAALRTSGVV